MGLFDSRPSSNYDLEKEVKFWKQAAASAKKQELKNFKLYVDTLLHYAQTAGELRRVQAELARLKEKYGEK